MIDQQCFHPADFSPSTNTSFPGPKHRPPAVGPKRKKPPGQAFAPRGSVFAIREAIRRADLPDPPRTSMMRTHTRALRNSNRRHHRVHEDSVRAGFCVRHHFGSTGGHEKSNYRPEPEYLQPSRRLCRNRSRRNVCFEPNTIGTRVLNSRNGREKNFNETA